MAVGRGRDLRLFGELFVLVSESARASNLNCWSCTVLSHRLPPLRASACSQTTPNRKSRQEQDGELVVLPDLRESPLNALSILRVSTSKSTTSRRATGRPPRARIPTCSCWSRYVLWPLKSRLVSHLCNVQLYRFLARRTDSAFNKVIYTHPSSYMKAVTYRIFSADDPPPPFPLQDQPSPHFPFPHRQGDRECA